MAKREIWSGSGTGVWLSGIILAGLFLRVYYLNGLIGSDDMFHAIAVLDILENGFSLPAGHHAARFGLFLPAMPVFAAFGLGDWQMAITPLLWSILSIFLAYWLGAYCLGRQGGLLAALMVAVFPLDIQQATRFYPDLPMGVCSALSVFVFLAAERYERRTLGAVLAGLIWGYAYLIKIEAAFLGFAYLALLIEDRRRFASIVVAGLCALAIVAIENAIYYSETGTLFYRLTNIVDNVKTRESASMRSLWAFPKSWFVTFYEFGLQYYLFFLGLALALLRRKTNLLLPAMWSLAMLAWLQFGFNPMAEFSGFKTHLSRYCSMISVPVAIVSAYVFLFFQPYLHRFLVPLAVAGTVAVALFMANFNSLSLERQIATKIALREAERNNWFPLYLDSYSYTFAQFIWRDTSRANQLHTLQDHDLTAGKTTLVDLNAVDGYVLVNQDSMRFRLDRYFEQPVDVSAAEQMGPRVFSVDNPLGALAYLQARFFLLAAKAVPPVGQLFGDTARHILQGEEVLVIDLRKNQ